MIKIIAIDANGKQWPKEVTISETGGKQTISFGSYSVYYSNDLLKNYPWTQDFDIDSMGKNHGGFGTGPVCISKKDMNRIVEELLLN